MFKSNQNITRPCNGDFLFIQYFVGLKIEK